MILATFLIEPDGVALRQTLEKHPELEIEAERIAAHSTTWTMPCLWMAAEEADIDEETLEADPTVDTVKETVDFNGEVYCNIEWSDAVMERINAYVDEGGTILEAYANAEGWRVQIRFVSDDQLDTFRERLHEQDYSFELLDLREPGAPRESFGDLTPEQYRVVVTAMELGYFRIPRETSLRELADELNKSHQTVSELLRRGMEKLVDAMLTTPMESGQLDEGSDDAT